MRPSLYIQAWKRVIDVIPIHVNLAPFLEGGETFSLSNVTTTVQVFAGYDTNPSDIINGLPLIDINNPQGFIQNLQHGLDGVIYTVIFTTITSTGRQLQQYLYLAILDEGLQPIAPIIPFYYTSWPYPIDQTESFQGSIIPQSANLLLNPYLIEYIQVSILPLTGFLIGALVTYNNPAEWFQTSIIPQIGTLTLALLFYNTPVESIQVSILPLGGVLTQTLVIYADGPDGFQVSITPLTGTLT